MNVVQSLNLAALQFCRQQGDSHKGEPEQFSRVRRSSVGVRLRNSLVLAAFATLAWADNASGAAFTSGSVVVERVGDGTAALGNGSTPVFLLEFPAIGGAALQTISLPNATTRPTATPFNLTEAGSANSGGQLTRSVNGLVLNISGYNGINGDASL